MLRSDFNYFRPGTAKQAIELAAEWGEEAVFLAGGTDLVLEMKREHRTPKALVEIARLPELNILVLTEDYLCIGAAVPLRVLAGAEAVRRHAPALAAAAAEIGSPQIRSVATLGGNIATGSAAGDSLPPLVAYDAMLVLEGPSGARSVEVGTYLGGRSSPGAELIREVRIPVVKAPHSGVFVKLGRRNALSIARISAAFVVRWSPTGKVQDAGLVLGAVGKAPVRVSEAERVIAGTSIDEKVAEQAAQLASDAVARSIPGRPSEPYKKRAVQGVVLEALEKVRNGRES